MTETTTREIGVTELVLRDGHQSLLATRMALEDMVAACADIDQAGYWSVECWGGATYDSCIRFLNEDPWERLRTFRKLMPNSRLQMLLRGQNLLGYRHYEDTVVDRFVEKSAENGMDVFRVFDALNDVRNLRRAIDAVRRTGKHAQGTICYTDSPAAHRRGLRRDGPATSWTWAATRSASRTWPRCSSRSPPTTSSRHQGDLRRGHLGPRPRPLDHRRHAGQPDEGDRGRRRHRRHVDLVAQPRPRPQPHRGPGRDARRHRLHARSWTTDRLLKIKDHFAKVRPRYAAVRVEDHRRRDRDLRQPDPRRHDLQHGEPAQAAGGRRPGQGGARRGAAGPQGRRLPAAGDAVQPDRRHPGGVQRADGPLQGADRRVRRPDARLLRRDDRRARPRDRRGRRQARQEGADHRPARRPAQAGVGRAARRGRRPSRAATAPTRTS